MSKNEKSKKSSKRGLTQKLILCILPMILATNILLSFGAYYFGKRALKDSSTELLGQIGKDAADLIESNLVQGLNYMKVLSTNKKLVDDNISWEQKREMLLTTCKDIGAKK